VVNALGRDTFSVTDEVINRIPLIVDLDAHVVEPPDVWSSRLPSRYQDTGPHIELLPDGVPKLVGAGYVEEPGTEGPEVAWWCYEDHHASLKRTIAAAGLPRDEVQLRGVRYDEMRPGCWRVPDRLTDIDLNGVLARMCFPRFPGQQFLRGKDRELARLCIGAYNDWMVDEWCGESDDRLIPLCLIPLWDAELAAAEDKRNAARGVRAVAFTEMPPYLELPSLYTGYWDPFLAGCQETNTVVWSGTLQRYPNLRFMYAEAQIGWIPYVFERADDVWPTHHGWSNSQRDCPDPPSTYFHRGNVISCFFKDAVGVSLLNQIGVNKVVFETDYPHSDSTWPNSRRAAAEQFGHLDIRSIRKIARENAIQLLDLSLPGG
jgi:predicted TIM-barrel fold metal-dependent hydrolase